MITFLTWMDQSFLMVLGSDTDLRPGIVFGGLYFCCVENYDDYAVGMMIVFLHTQVVRC